MNFCKQNLIPNYEGSYFTLTVRIFCVFTFIKFYCYYFWSLRWDRPDGPPAAWPVTSALSAAALCSLTQRRCWALKPAQLLPLWCKAGAMRGRGGPGEPWIYPAPAGGHNSGHVMAPQRVAVWRCRCRVALLALMDMNEQLGESVNTINYG